MADGALPLFDRLRKRLSNRPDSEHGQAIVRLAMLIVVYAYLAFAFAGDLQLALQRYRRRLACGGQRLLQPEWVPAHGRSPVARRASMASSTAGSSLSVSTT